MKRITQYFRLTLISLITFVMLVSCIQKSPPTVKTGTAVVTANFTIIANGQVTSDGNDDLSSYGICLSQNPVPTIADTKKDCSSNGNSDTHFIATFYNMDANFTYYLRAYAINSEGISYGEVVMVKVSSAPSIKNASVTLITKTEVTLSATVNAQNLNSENSFQYWAKDEAVRTISAGTSNGNNDLTVSVTVSGLTPGKTYSFAAKAKNEFGETSSDTLTFDTYAVADADGNVYHSITIGTQVWMIENLKTTKYRDGTAIPVVTDNTAWAALSTPAYCWYNNDAITYKNTFGALYNWYAVNTAKLAPTGWHVASDAEWTTLENYLIANGYNYDGTTSGNKIAKSLAATTDWYSYTGTGTIGNYLTKNNTSGFTALPGGGRALDGSFYGIGFLGLWWSSSEADAAYALFRVLDYSNVYLNWGYATKSYGFSVRCVRD